MKLRSAFCSAVISDHDDALTLESISTIDMQINGREANASRPFRIVRKVLKTRVDRTTLACETTISPASNGRLAVHSDKAVLTDARPPLANGRAPQMKFLVVDDSATMRRIVVNSLQRIGFTDCIEASDGIDALAKFDSSIAFVITDWNMPNMSGTELVQALRMRNDGRVVPVLMVTARSVREDIITALEAGVNNYIVKPFTPQVLKEKIDSLIIAPAA